MAESSEALRHLKIPSLQIKRTGVELGKGSYGKVFEVDYSGKLCAAKEIHSLLLELQCILATKNFDIRLSPGIS